MNDPYKVLGISQDADEDEIKKAYRALARKYHPDRYAGKPELQASAEQKMKEINAAYEEIQAIRSGKKQNNGYGGYNGYNSYGGNGAYGSSSSYGQSDPTGDTFYVDVRHLINNGAMERAYTLLQSVSEQKRGAEWHFLMGCVYVRSGRRVDASREFDIACGMDPHNAEYRAARDRFKQRSNDFRSEQSDVGRGCSCCNICTALFCANLCCNCMRRGL